MSFKILGQITGSTDNQAVYTVPASNEAVCNIALCNRGGTAATFRLALSTSTSPTDAQWINYDEALPANGTFERTGVCLQAGKVIVLRSSNTDVSCSVWGSEKAV
jgi:hypothetical protein